MKTGEIMSTTISVSDIGPVAEFEYTMDAPGLHVLRGPQGVGKTTILRTVQLATDGRTDIKPTKRDGAKRGEAVVAGKTIRIAKQVREEGELSVEGLGDLDLAALHSPKYADADTRDRHRIRALVRLAGIEADPALFRPLLGEDFDLVVDADALKTDDLVEMAARVKRAIEKAALARESQEQTALANMQAADEAAAALMGAEKRFELAVEKKIGADKLLESASLHAEMTNRWRADIESAKEISCPPEDAINAAHTAVEQASAAVTLGVKVRAAIDAQQKATEYAEESNRHATAARRLRQSAAATFDVLSDSIAQITDCPLRVLVNTDGDARLVLKTDRSDAEPLDDLSDGERWGPLLDIAAARGKLIVIPQASFGEWSTAMRNRMDRLARDKGCYLLTAAVDDGQLRGEPWLSQSDL